VTTPTSQSSNAVPAALVRGAERTASDDDATQRTERRSSDGGPNLEHHAYGVRLSLLGEDGDWIALGHVEPRRMLAAMRRVSRLEGWEDIDAYDTLPELLAGVQHRRAVFTELDDEDHPHADAWWCRFGASVQHHPAAVDVTVYGR
jgi:hypothetical protein